MSQGFGHPAFAIDTHIHRLAQRWGLTSGKNVIQTEKDLKKLSNSWDRMDYEDKSIKLSNLVKPILDKSLPSSARIEELVWNCIIAKGWKTDLAGQLSFLKKDWGISKNPLKASNLVDILLNKGHV